jgi:hypothetical protein
MSGVFSPDMPSELWLLQPRGYEFRKLGITVLGLGYEGLPYS